MPFRKISSESSDPTLPQIPYIAYGKEKKKEIENLNFIFAGGQNVFQLT